MGRRSRPVSIKHSAVITLQWVHFTLTSTIREWDE